MMVACMAIIAAFKLSWDLHFYDGYDPKAPLNVVIRAEEDRPAYRRIDFTFDGYPGEAVPSIMALPKVGGRFPVLIFLHGIGQNKKFIDEIAEPFIKEGYAMVTFDQLLQGEREVNGNYLKQGLEFRRRGAATVNETRRLIDYLETRPDIDTKRCFLLGASYGAITGSTVAAFDKRLAGVVLCYGGGDIRKLVDSKMAGEVVGPAMPLAKEIAAWYMGPADPCRYASHISPTPVLFQAGKNDSLVPPASSAALIDAAKDPKDVIWYDSDHIGFDRAHAERVLNDALAWVKAHDKGAKK